MFELILLRNGALINQPCFLCEILGVQINKRCLQYLISIQKNIELKEN